MESTAVELAAAVRGGTADPVQLVTEALARIAAHDGNLGAFQVVRAEAALAEAAEIAGRADLADLPLAGVPIAIKDNVPVQGEPMRDGSSATSAEPQPRDHEVVRRLRAAGAVVVGTTRVPELCVFGTTDSTFGISRNPWDLERTPGGSSGGSAAAVAAGLVPVALGNDGMGSIRIPAACCGLVGIKPGFGVVPAGISVNDWYAMSENGPLATTVADAALFLSVLAASPALATPVLPERRLRIAVSLTPPLTGLKPDREHLKAVIKTALRLEAAGHELVRVDPPYPKNPLPAVARWLGGASVDSEGLDRSLLDPAVRRHALLGDQVRSRGLIKDSDRVTIRTALTAFFADIDVLLTPVLAAPPIAAARWGQRPWAATAAASVRYAPYPALWNFAQYPSAAVPAGVHPTVGTPLSVMLSAPDGGEALLIGLAAQIEQLAPWQRLAPGY